MWPTVYLHSQSSTIDSNRETLSFYWIDNPIFTIEPSCNYVSIDWWTHYSTSDCSHEYSSLSSVSLYCSESTVHTSPSTVDSDSIDSHSETVSAFYWLIDIIILIDCILSIFLSNELNTLSESILCIFNLHCIVN